MRRLAVRVLWGLLIVIVGVGILAAVLIETGAVDRWARGYIVRKIEASTGSPVELGALHLKFTTLEAELDGFTIHGKEGPGLPPFFHADVIHVRAHIISLFQHKVSLEDVEVTRPSIFIRIGENGKSNIPTGPPRKNPKPWREQLFNLQIANLKISDGTILFNDAKVPFDAEGKDFRFAMNYEARTPGKDAYTGEFGWRDFQIADRRYLPFIATISSRFTLTRNALSIDDLELRLPHSLFSARADISNFKPLSIRFHSKSSLSLPDLRTILRKPAMPDGQVEFTANGSYAGKQLHLTGHYAARGIALKFQWFHAAGIASWGDIEVADNQLKLPSYHATALGGHLDGNLEMNFHGVAFQTKTHFAGADLGQLMAAVNNPDLPSETLHWSGNMNVDSICSWNRDFKHLTARGITTWSPRAQTPPGFIVVTAKIPFDYSMDRSGVQLAKSAITTPHSRVQFEGALAKRDSSLNVSFHTDRIADWSDFIAYLRGPKSRNEHITGAADWNGQMIGPINGPEFAGSFHARDAHFGRLYWDDITGQMLYSPDEFQLQNAVVKRGRSQANLSLELELDKWNFGPDDTWALNVQIANSSSDDLQALLGSAYPASATIVSANFEGSGTRAEPVLDGNFHLRNVESHGIFADEATGQLSLRHDLIRLNNVHLMRGSGQVSGNLNYQLSTRNAGFQISGKDLSLAQFKVLQTKSLPIAGALDFALSGEGPISAPRGQGSLHVNGLKFGAEVLGDFAGTAQSDGAVARLAVLSTKTPGMLEGNLSMALSGDYPLTGKVNVRKIDLDPFIAAGLHLTQMTGHSSIDGQLTISGDARKPDTIAMTADLSRVLLNFEYVSLQNRGPIRLSYGQSIVHVEQANLSGKDTDFHLSGTADFAGSKALNLNVAGAINLRLAEALFPGLNATGSAQLNTSIAGTYTNPQIIGQAKIENASAHYGDFPAGINNLNGSIIFDRNQLLFDNMAAQAGGGRLVISGAIAYGRGPMHYEVNATAAHVRIRYPEGMSWMLDGNVRFSGGTKAALLSGNLTVERVVFAQNVDFASLVLASGTPLTGPTISSAYLRNLQFDISAGAATSMRIDWAGAHFTADGGVRIRGTWEHPVVLGNIHLLEGDMTVRGNTYHLTRGDITFSNPARFDPVLNIEASTNINPYEITLDFSGPASRMQVSYRSDPPLPSSEIVNLLALGSTGEETALMSSSSAQTQNFGATAILSEAISSQIGGPIERLFGVTNFRIDPFLASNLAASGVEQSTAARVTIQKQVTRGLSVTYSTNAASNQQQVVEVDYAIRRDITIVALRDINGIYGVNIKFTRHFR